MVPPHRSRKQIIEFKDNCSSNSAVLGDHHQVDGSMNDNGNPQDHIGGAQAQPIARSHRHSYSSNGLFISSTMIMILVVFCQLCMASNHQTVETVGATRDDGATNTYTSGTTNNINGRGNVSWHGNGPKDEAKAIVTPDDSFTVYYYETGVWTTTTCTSFVACLSYWMACSNSTWSSTITYCYTDFMVVANSGWFIGSYVDNTLGITRQDTNWATSVTNTFASISDTTLDSSVGYTYSCHSSITTRNLYMRLYCFASYCSQDIEFGVIWALSSCGITWQTTSTCTNCANITTSDCYYSEVGEPAPDDEICTDALGSSPVSTGYCVTDLSYTSTDWSTCSCSGTQTRITNCTSGGCYNPSSVCLSYGIAEPATLQTCTAPSSCSASSSSSSSSSSTIIGIAVGVPVGVLVLVGLIGFCIRRRRRSPPPPPPAKDPTPSMGFASPSMTSPNYYINTMASPAGAIYGSNAGMTTNPSAGKGAYQSEGHHIAVSPAIAPPTAPGTPDPNGGPLNYDPNQAFQNSRIVPMQQNAPVPAPMGVDPPPSSGFVGGYAY